MAVHRPLSTLQAGAVARSRLRLADPSRRLAGTLLRPRPTAQAWSRATWEDLDEIDALLYPSSMHGGATNVAFYERARSALPDTPDRVLPLSLPAFEADLIRFATDLGYAVR